MLWRSINRCRQMHGCVYSVSKITLVLLMDGEFHWRRNAKQSVVLIEFSAQSESNKNSIRIQHSIAAPNIAVRTWTTNNGAPLDELLHRCVLTSGSSVFAVLPHTAHHRPIHSTSTTINFAVFWAENFVHWLRHNHRFIRLFRGSFYFFHFLLSIVFAFSFSISLVECNSSRQATPAAKRRQKNKRKKRIKFVFPHFRFIAGNNL